VLAAGLVGHAGAQEATDTGFIATTDGQRLFYRIDGDSADRIIVVHGGPGMSLTYLQPELTELAESHRLIYYDQRGGGLSSLTSTPELLHADKHIEDLEAVRRHFAIDRLTLLGHSWGAGLAALYAARYPEHVERLILSSSMPPRMEPYIAEFENNLIAWMDDTTLAQVERLEAVRATADSVEACNAFWRVFIRAYVADHERPPAFRGGPCDMPVPALRNSETVTDATLSSLGVWDWRSQLATIRVPTLVIHGDRDPIPLDAAREWASALPNATLSVVQRSGHFPFVEQRAVFLQSVRQFLDMTAAPR